MSSHDLVRVFKGVGLVVDHMVLINKAGLREKISRAQFHVTELMKVGSEIRSEMSSETESDKPQPGHSTVQNSYNNVRSSSAFMGSSSATGTAPPFVVPPTKEAADIPVVDTATATLTAETKSNSYQMPTMILPTSQPSLSVQVSNENITGLNSVSKTAPISISIKPTDLIGFDQVMTEKMVGESKQKNVRNGDTVINGVRTSSMRERAVPATQLVLHNYRFDRFRDGFL